MRIWNPFFQEWKLIEIKKQKKYGLLDLKKKNIITSTADKDSVFIISDAELKAAKIKGDADAKSATIYNDAFSKDVEYFEYLKYLDMYKQTLKSQDALFIMNEKNQFLKFLFEKNKK